MRNRVWQQGEYVRGRKETLHYNVHSMQGEGKMYQSRTRKDTSNNRGGKDTACQGRERCTRYNVHSWTWKSFGSKVCREGKDVSRTMSGNKVGGGEERER